MKKYIQLLRIKNYIKNFLIFLPFVFSGKCLTFDNTYLIMILGFIAFCLSSSFIYIINDLLDRHEDKLHAVKCQRPLASGALSCGQAICVDIVLALSIMIIMLFLHNVWLCLLIGIYIGLILLDFLFGMSPIYQYILDDIIILRLNLRFRKNDGLAQ